MNNMKILVSGASVAGITLAYWLNENGFEVTIVENPVKLEVAVILLM